MKLRTGLTEFKNDGKFTPNFIGDVNMLISKIYAQWSLYEDEDEFNASCWCKIITALQIYNEESSSLSTYLNSVIWNEATRIHSKHKKMSCDDVEGVSYTESLWSQSYKEESDLLLRDRVFYFVKRAYDMGVYVDQQELYKNYLLGNLSPAVKAFMWGSLFAGGE